MQYPLLFSGGSLDQQQSVPLGVLLVLYKQVMYEVGEYGSGDHVPSQAVSRRAYGGIGDTRIPTGYGNPY